VAAVLLAAVAAGCDSSTLTDLNNNPNAPTQVEPEQLFTSAASDALSTLRGSSFEHGLSALWVQHYAEIQYPEADHNKPRSTTIEALFNNLYALPIQDLTATIAKGGTRAGIVGPAVVMRSFVFHEITDLWGDVPYTDAAKGDLGAEAILSPRYDAQSVIYDSLFLALASANTMLASATNEYGSADPIYDGSPAQWRKLANSLRMRMAMRLTKLDAGSTRAKAEFLAAMAGPVMTSNADNAKIDWPGGVTPNPLYLNWIDLKGGTRDDQRLSKRFVDTLAINGDPRLALYAQPTDSSKKCSTPGCWPASLGYPNGVSANTLPLPTVSRPTESIRQATSPSYIMRYEEVLFLRAEAAARGWTTDNPATLYNAAITASMQLWGASATEIATYLAAHPYNPATGLTQIAYEKWVALFNEETQAYAEWRRTGVPVLTPGPKAAFATVPRRLTYASLETSLNSTNVAAATTNQGGAALTNRVWWDK